MNRIDGKGLSMSMLAETKDSVWCSCSFLSENVKGNFGSICWVYTFTDFHVPRWLKGRDPIKLTLQVIIFFVHYIDYS